MPTIQEISDYLATQAPLCLAEDWDNVGLLVGDPSRPVQRLMTCLTVTPASVDESVREKIDLIVTHHPLPFRPLQRLTTQTVAGELLLRVISAGIGVYSAHTAYDSARMGINVRLAEGCGLVEIQPLVPSRELPELGAGRWGRLTQPVTLDEMTTRVRKFLGLRGLQRVGSPERLVHVVAVACGSAGQFLSAARAAGCELLVTGETNFHTCLEAEATGMALLLPGHFASERFAVEHLATTLAGQFPDVKVWASRAERDPLQWVAEEQAAT